MYIGVGVRFAEFISFLLNISSVPPDPPLDPPLIVHIEGSQFIISIFSHNIVFV